MSYIPTQTVTVTSTEVTQVTTIDDDFQELRELVCGLMTMFEWEAEMLRQIGRETIYRLERSE